MVTATPLEQRTPAKEYPSYAELVNVGSSPAAVLLLYGDSAADHAVSPGTIRQPMPRRLSVCLALGQTPEAFPPASAGPCSDDGQERFDGRRVRAVMASIQPAEQGIAA